MPDTIILQSEIKTLLKMNDDNIDFLVQNPNNWNIRTFNLKIHSKHKPALVMVMPFRTLFPSSSLKQGCSKSYSLSVLSYGSLLTFEGKKKILWPHH